MKRLLPLLGVLALATSGCARPSAGGPSALPAVPDAKVAGVGSPGQYIKHVVIVIQENRSFDNYFAGWHGAQYAPLSGLEKSCATCPVKTVPLHEVTFGGNYDLVHDYQGGFASVDGGKMDGFGVPLLGQALPTATKAYGYVSHSQIAPYRTMAYQYTLADHMFPEELSSSFTGHLDLIAGTTDLTPSLAVIDMPTGSPWGCDAPPGTITWTVNPARQVKEDGPYPCFTQFRTMADTLDAKNVSWKFYQPPVFSPLGSWSPFDAIANVRCATYLPLHDRCVGYGKDWTAHILSASPQTLVLTDPAQGKLPSVSWVTPDFKNSDHLNSQSDTGPSWVAAVVNAIGQSPDWSSTAIVVVWDDWGGWFDAAPPPNYDDFRGPGIRVPCLIISPYARRGYVSHTTYGFSSILRFVEETFNLTPLGSGAEGYTDTRANSIVDAFDFTQAPRKFVPIPAKYPTSYFLTQTPSYRQLDDDDEGQAPPK